MTLGDRLKTARKHAGLSQTALEERSGVSQQTISNIEKGIQDKSTDVVQLAVACGVRPEWLAMASGEMTDGLYVSSEKLKHMLMVAQELPDYAIDIASQEVDSIAELVRKTREADTGKTGSA